MAAAWRTALSRFMRLCVQIRAANCFFALAYRAYNAHIPRFYAAAVYHHAAGKTRACGFINAFARGGGLCGYYAARGGSLSPGRYAWLRRTIKTPQGLFFCACGGVVFISYILYYIYSFFLFALFLFSYCMRKEKRRTVRCAVLYVIFNPFPRIADRAAIDFIRLYFLRFLRGCRYAQ